MFCKFVWYEILQMLQKRSGFYFAELVIFDNLTVIGFSWGENNSSSLQSGSLIDF